MMGQDRVSRDQALREEIVSLADALVVPPRRDEPPAPTNRSGVFDREGRFVIASVQQRATVPLNTEPVLPSPDGTGRLAGTWLYGGVLFGHFGHFLVESLARVWALDHLAGRLDGVLFVPKANTDNFDHVLRTQQPLLDALGVSGPVRLIRDPVTVERLHVPYQGIGIGELWETATPAFRAYMRRHGGRHIAPAGPERVYLSRSALGAQRAGLLLERRLEAHLEAAGYAIVHPQQLGKADQVALYRKARVVISPDGSPLHLLAYVGDAGQRVAVLARRSNATHGMFEEQLRAFCGIEAVTLSPLRAEWMRAGQTVSNRLSWGEPDFPQLRRRLIGAGFLPPDTPDWPDATPEEIEAAVQEIATREGTSYRRHPT